MTRIVDFDAFRAERQGEPIQLRIGGKEYELPPSLPAAVAVDFIHLSKRIADDEDVPVEVLDTTGTAIFGPLTWRAILQEHRIGIDELGDLIKMVLNAYTGEKKPGPQKASTRATKRSASVS